ncbi:UNVERIFIED_ORG: xylulose-5-phosphate/fructose-6-phosphate phosphoketolase [Kosakonia oryzae]|uniref:Probable phosphoketolase n=1 Tax=Kosakonia radicincitans TaxID=283686 RepID=A0AAX2ERF6_9ENTR|nr:phosphoketolase family protein [Kosakonia radicincitans]MDP9567496.1 xylulose-5-phosphate/fructose-6-phosphate phosphoketolase [Kosakonia oryzae]APG18402.1 phosphoketolase [Kosakonia radicincitans]MDD7995565.1 phosphoketolase family protein [Kosakonia radicincitans]SFE90106.1 xylulose-5-phosphate/fructose-6-phosphate phosphoketolase [Kosakonia radicincitans]SFR10971.1 xylulose-5-phosphate/fructose-6-phosphate phosphoketolase [Kosakonia radicincitans]
MTASSLSDHDIQLIDRYWRAANYLSVGQIYLMDNPLLREPLKPEHIKPRLLGHWGTTPGLNFIYAHLNRVIRQRNLDMIYICGPGHGGPGMVANTWLEGSYSEIYPQVSQDAQGMKKLFRQFSFPGGIPSHAAPETPGSINEGGELGYSLAHAFGAVFDNPSLIAACVIGDGEAETGPLASSWHGIKFLNAARDGAVLPILHLNGYKIANPTILGRASDEDLFQLFRGYGYEPLLVSGHEPEQMHRDMAQALDIALDHIADFQQQARSHQTAERLPRWPLILLRSPKGWTGPQTVDGKKVEDFWRAHQVPVSSCRENDDHRQILQRWMQSYQPEDLFDERGQLKAELRALAPTGDKRMGASPWANGGRLRRELVTPALQSYAVEVTSPGETQAESTAALGAYLAGIFQENADNFRLFGPDETASNRLSKVFDVTSRTWQAAQKPWDEQLAPDGRVMEILSEHQCQGWLEGYLLTGRHGLFNCYEAFIHIVDSMFNQHAKWLKVTRKLPWRAPISSLNYLLSSHVWRQDHNGYSHQDPGFIDHVANKKADIVRIYLPPDANTLLCVADHCLKTWDRINVIVAGKQPAPQWLTLDDAAKHCADGMGIWYWAGTVEEGETPDVVMACAGDVPTMETLAAVDLLREFLPALRIQVVNVVDLMALQTHDQHPHGLSEQAFDALFTVDKPVVFAFHGYPSLIHRLTYLRNNHGNFHVRGFMEEGTTTTPFDMTVLNELDRFHLAQEAILRVPSLQGKADAILDVLQEKIAAHHRYVREYGEDLPEVQNWKWPSQQGSDAAPE